MFVLNFLKNLGLVIFTQLLHLFNYFYNRKKRAKQRIVDIPPLTRTRLEEIIDPLDYLYKYCIIQ